MLTDRARQELHNSILEYLTCSGFSQSQAVFAAELDEAMKKKQFKECALAKKWSCITRLNEANVALEQKCKLLESEIAILHDPQKLRSKMQDKLPTEPCRFTLRGHRDTVTSVAFHPHQSLCYSGSEDGTVHVWDYESGEDVKTLRGHTAGVTQIAVSPDGKLLASCSADNTVKVFDTASNNALLTLHGHSECVSCVAWMGDAVLLSGGRDQTLRMWSPSTGQAVQSTMTEEWIRSIAVNGKGPMIATAGNADGCQPLIRIWRVQTPFQHLRTIAVHENVIEHIVFSSMESDEVLVERYGTAEQKKAWKENKARRKENAPPDDSRYILSGSRDKNMKIIDVASGAEMETIAVHDNWVRNVGFSANGKCIVSCSDDNTFRVYDITKGRATRVEAHGHFVTCQALHPAAKPYYLTGSADMTVRVWPCM